MKCVYCAVRTGSLYRLYAVHVNTSPSRCNPTDLHKHNRSPPKDAAVPVNSPRLLLCVSSYFFPLHFPTKICVSFSPVRCISSTYWNLICFRLVFQTPSFGLATLRGRLLTDTSYLTQRTTKEGERTFSTPCVTVWRCYLLPQFGACHLT